MRKNAYILITCLLALFSCTKSNTCTITDDIALQIRFYSDSIDTLGNYVAFEKPIDSLTLQGVGNDSVILSNTKSVSRISLPLRNTDTITAYALTINGTPDTLTIRHQNTDVFVSLQCGCFTYHTVENVTESACLFDSIAYIEYEIGRVQTENIRLFWH